MTFVRFPSTAHLAVDEPAQRVRADKVLSPEQAEVLLSDAVRVEEKVVGDNLGFSVQAGELRVQAPWRLRASGRGLALSAPRIVVGDA